MFFFFKQKTAYEMRISDWSSDVCSSDLRARRRAQDGVASGRSETFGDVETDDARVEREDIGAQARVVAVGEAVGDRRVVEEILDVKLHREQIGRASCRERVCQYV